MYLKNSVEFKSSADKWIFFKSTILIKARTQPEKKGNVIGSDIYSFYRTSYVFQIMYLIVCLLKVYE